MAAMDTRDGLDTSLAGLRTYDADLQTVDQIRVRCLAALEAQRRQERKGQLRLAEWRRRFELAAAFGLCCLYLALAVASAFALLH